MEIKNPLKSKTVLFNLVLTVSGVVSIFLPMVGDFVTAHSAMILSVIGIIGVALRSVTNGKIGFGEDS